MIKVFEWMKTHLAVVDCIVLFLVGAGLGWKLRGNGPPKIEYREHETIKTEYKDREVVRYVEVQVKETKKQYHKHETIVKKPDGTTVTTEDTTAGSDTETTDKKNGSDDKSAQGSSVAQKDVVRIQTPAPVPKWTVSVLVGADVTRGLAPAYGAAVSYKVLGPFSVGAWGLSTGVGGVSVGFQF